MPRGQTAEELGIPLGTLVKVELEGRVYKATSITGEDVTDKIEGYALRNAFRSSKALLLTATKTGGTSWRQVPAVDFDKAKRGEAVAVADLSSLNIGGEQNFLDSSMFQTHDDLKKYIEDSFQLKPRKLKIDPVTWKFGIRTVLRGNNMLIVGPSGCGKTLFANALKVALGREDKFFYINLGAAQDPRSTLVGNTHYDPTKGTYVALSEFIEGIQVPGAMILIDEVSRGGADATNILMTVLDYTQRYLRVDEMADHPTVKVAPGVSFILTANIGSEYTGTRTMDRALLDRCDIVEMEPLGEEQEFENLREMFPDVEEKLLKAVVDVTMSTRTEMKSETKKCGTIISTRMSEKWVGSMYDGLTFVEAAEKCVIPYFDAEGGSDSPRSFVKILIQKHSDNIYGKKKTVYEQNDPDLNNGKVKPW